MTARGRVPVAVSLLISAYAVACNPNRVVVDLCASVDCSGHGTCSMKGGAATCTCASGYTASGATQCVADPCTGVTCSGHGTCSVTNGAAACACDSGYSVSGGTQCVSAPCTGVTCSGHGTCSATNGAAACACDSGYRLSGSTECLPGPCTEVTCSGHGTCMEVSGDGRCACDFGYRLSETDATECVTDPCARVTCSGHGTCSLVNVNTLCACDTGYLLSGTTECLLDACAGVTCSGHGTCSTPSGGGVQCTCDPGYLVSGVECIDMGKQVAVGAAPMGWASWNVFASLINSTKIKAQVDALVASGLPSLGYKYVLIEEGWWDGSRDPGGHIAVDPTAWPGGMAAVAEYIHSKGLKAGIYTDAGKNGCGYYNPTPSDAAPAFNSGSEGHYEQDMKDFQEWGFDYVKVDWCGGSDEGLDGQATYQQISNAISAATAATSRAMVFSISEWGSSKPWNWAAGTGTLWRTGSDIFKWGSPATLSAAVTGFLQVLHPTSQHTGYFNDPDRLTVGLSGLSDSQARTEMSLWAISGAPLLASNDLAAMNAATKAILGNAKAIAIDQDPRGLQGFSVSEDSFGLRVYGKVLAGKGRRAVVLHNTTSASATMAVRLNDLGLTSAAAMVRDVWGTAQGTYQNLYSTTVPANDSVLLTVAGTEADAVTFEAEATANTLTGGAAVGTCSACSGGSKVTGIGSGAGNSLTMAITAPSSGLYLADIAYMNGDTAARKATIRINTQFETTVSFPPTGGWDKVGTVSLLVSLGKGNSSAVISNTAGSAPDLDALTLQALPGAGGRELVRRSSGACVGLADNSITDGTQASLETCSGGPNQIFRRTSRNELVLYGYQCLDVYGQSTTPGSRVGIWPCNGGTNEQWNVRNDGTIIGVQSGLCLDANGTVLILNSCNGSADQKWTLN